MNFKEAYQRYLRGEAAPEEVALVEEELEKFRLLTDRLAEEEPPPLPEPAPAAAETYRRARRAVKRRSVWIVAVSVALACALAVGGPAVYRSRVVPWLNEEVYLNPLAMTYPELVGLTDLSITIDALTELVDSEWSATGGVRVDPTGVGRYDLRVDGRTADGAVKRVFGTLDRGTFHFEEDLLTNQLFVFTYDTMPFTERFTPALEEILPRLEELPRYVEVRSAVSFGRDLSMEELAGLMDRHPDLRFGWVGVRAAELTEQRLPLVGFDYGRSGYVVDINEDYPYFNLAWEEKDPDALEGHFKALLQYAVDHPELVNPLCSEDPDSTMHLYFQERLDYVGEHGVKTYGAYVTGTAEDLVRLCREEDDVCGLNIQDLSLVVPD